MAGECFVSKSEFDTFAKNLRRQLVSFGLIPATPVTNPTAGVSLFGSGAANQVAVWASTYVLSGSSALTWSGSVLSSTGAISVSGNIQTASALVSTVAIGTAPLQVTSTTMVANLNTQYLGGNLAAAFALSGHNHATAYAPLEHEIDGASHTASAPLSISKGGTGVATLAQGYIPFGNVTSALGSSSSLFWDDTNREFELRGDIGFYHAACPTTAPTVATGAAGTHKSCTASFPMYYAVSYITAFGETECGPVSTGITTDDVQIEISSIPIGPTGTTGRKIYRTLFGMQKLVATISNNSTTDITDDLSYTDWNANTEIGIGNTTAGIIRAGSYAGMRFDEKGQVSFGEGLLGGTNKRRSAFTFAKTETTAYPTLGDSIYNYATRFTYTVAPVSDSAKGMYYLSDMNITVPVSNIYAIAAIAGLSNSVPVYGSGNVSSIDGLVSSVNNLLSGGAAAEYVKVMWAYGSNQSDVTGFFYGLQTNVDSSGGTIAAARASRNRIAVGYNSYVAKANPTVTVSDVVYANTEMAGSVGGIQTIGTAYGFHYELLMDIRSYITTAYGVYIGAAPTDGSITDLYGLYLADQTKAGTTNNYALYSAGGNIYFAGNVGVGIGTFGASATKTIAIASGIAPTTSPVDAFQMYSADFEPGNACPYFRTENGTVVGLNQSVLTTAAPTFFGMTLTGPLAYSQVVDSQISPLSITQTAALLQDGSANTGTDETMDNVYEAVKFTASGNHVVSSIKFKAKMTGTLTVASDLLWATLYSDNAGVPGASLGTFKYMRQIVLTSNFVEYDLGSVTPITLVSSTVYWIVFRLLSAPVAGAIILDSINSGTASHAYSANGTSWTTEDSKTLYFKLLGRTGVAVYGSSENNHGVYGYSVNGYGVYGFSEYSYAGNFVSTHNIAVYASSENTWAGYFYSHLGGALSGISGHGYGVYASSTDGIGLQVSGSNNYVGYFYRNTATPTNAVPVVYIIQHHASDTNPAFVIDCHGTGPILELRDNTAAVFSVLDGGHVLLAQVSEPDPTTNKLYNISGTLRWNGNDVIITGANPTFAGLTLSGGNLIIGPVHTDAGDTGEIQFRELAVNGTNYIAFKAPDSLGASKTFVLPNDYGTLGYALVDSDGAGTLAWAAIGTGGFANPMTTAGDLIFIDNLHATTRLGIGAEGTVLTAVTVGDHVIPQWSAAPAGLAVGGDGAPAGQIQYEASGNLAAKDEFYFDSANNDFFNIGAKVGAKVASFRNTSAGTASSTAILLGNDSSADEFFIRMNSSTFTGEQSVARVWNKANTAILFGANDTEVMRVAPDLLAVSGKANIGGTSLLADRLAVTETSYNQFRIVNGAQSLWIRQGFKSDGTAIPAVDANNVQFQSSGSATGSISFTVGNAEAMRISTAGYVGINNVTIPYMLSVGEGSGIATIMAQGGAGAGEGSVFYAAGTIAMGDKSSIIGSGTDHEAWVYSYSAKSLNFSASSNTSPHVTILYTGLVGVGTVVPAETLHLSAPSVALLLEANTQGANLKRWRIVPSIVAAGDLAFQTMNDNETVKSTNFYITNAGFVSVGTTSPARDFVLYKASAPTFQLANSTTGVGASDGSYLQLSGNDLYIGNQETSGKVILFTDNDGAKAICLSGGNVSLGPYTTPATRLVLSGSGNDNPNVGAEVDYVGQNITFVGVNTGGTFTLGGIKVVQPTGYYVNEADLVFSTNADGSFAERVRITKDGYLGVGVVPTAKFDVGGTSKFAGRITLTDAGYFCGAPSYGFRFNDNTSSYSNFIIYESGNTWTRGNAGIGVAPTLGALHIAQSSGSNAIAISAGSAIFFGDDVYIRAVSHADGFEFSNYNWGSPTRPKILCGSVVSEGTVSAVTAISIASSTVPARLTITDSSKLYSGEVGSIVLMDSSNVNKKLFFGFDAAIGAKGAGYIASVFSGDCWLPIIINPAGAYVGIGINTAPSYPLDVYVSTDMYPLRLQSSGKYVTIGPANASYCHFSTDASVGFWFSSKITVDEGVIRSYNEDLVLQRQDVTKLTLGTHAYTASGVNLGVGMVPFQTVTIPSGEGYLGCYTFEAAANAASRRWWIHTDYQNYGDFVISTELTKQQSANPNAPRFYISHTGDMGIGTVSPGGYKLNVTGTGYFSISITTPTILLPTGAAVGYVWQCTHIGGAGAWAPNAGSGGGTVNGTTNYLAKFTAATVVGNSSVTDDGTTVSVLAAKKFFVVDHNVQMGRTYYVKPGTDTLSAAISTMTDGDDGYTFMLASDTYTQTVAITIPDGVRRFSIIGPGPGCREWKKDPTPDEWGDYKGCVILFTNATNGIASSHNTTYQDYRISKCLLQGFTLLIENSGLIGANGLFGIKLWGQDATNGEPSPWITIRDVIITYGVYNTSWQYGIQLTNSFYFTIDNCVLTRTSGGHSEGFGILLKSCMNGTVEHTVVQAYKYAWSLVKAADAEINNSTSKHGCEDVHFSNSRTYMSTYAIYLGDKSFANGFDYCDLIQTTGRVIEDYTGGDGGTFHGYNTFTNIYVDIKSDWVGLGGNPNINAIIITSPGCIIDNMIWHHPTAAVGGTPNFICIDGTTGYADHCKVTGCILRGLKSGDIGINVVGSEGTTVTDNTVEGEAGSTDIYLDANSSKCTCIGNHYGQVITDLGSGNEVAHNVQH